MHQGQNETQRKPALHLPGVTERSQIKNKGAEGVNEWLCSFKAD